MTNLVASIVVALVTNTTEQIYTPPVQVYGCLVYGCKQDHYKDAEEASRANRTRAVYTECKEVTTLSFEWNGRRDVTSENLIWTVQNYKLDNSWKPVGVPQPAMPMDV